MSSILHSLSETKSHAPLSSGQTVAVFQQLHSDILNAMQLIDNQRKGLERQGDGLLKLMNEMSLTNAGLEDLRQEFRTMGERVEAVSQRTADNLAVSEKLKTGLRLAREDVGHLREGQQTTNNNVEILRTDLKARGNDIKGLRAEVDEVLKVAVQSVQEKADQALLNLRALTLDHEKSKKDASVQRGRLQDAADEMKAAKRGLEKLEAAVGKQGSTLADACNNVEATKTNLEITNAVIYKMNETREATMLDIANLKDGAKAANARIDSLHAEHAKTARDLSIARDDLSSAQAAVGEARLEVGSCGDQILALRERHEKTATHLGRIGNDLATVKNLASSTKQHLDVTNSMVLPNLGPGDLSTQGLQSSFEGSRTLGFTAPGGFGRTLSPSATPRRRREGTWTARNIGSVPDRMSWI